MLRDGSLCHLSSSCVSTLQHLPLFRLMQSVSLFILPHTPSALSIIQRSSSANFRNSLTPKARIAVTFKFETILKIYNNLVLLTFLYGSENWTLTALQRRRIEAAEMKLLRPLAGYTLYNHKTKDSVRRELQTECILDKTDEYRRNWLLHLQRFPLN
jgi:hypothetical protein